MDILITGSTVHSRQYVEAYMFNRNIKLSFLPDCENKIDEEIKHYGIEFVGEREVKSRIESYDVVIVANYLDKKMKVLKLLHDLNYSGKCVVEKPFASNRINYLTNLSYLKNINYFVAYSRQLYRCSIEEKIFNNLIEELYWPNFCERGIDIVIDTLPHVLDFLLIANGDDMFDVRLDEETKERFVIIANTKNHPIKVIIYNTNKYDFVRTKDVEFEWPNYFEYNMKILECLSDEYFLDKNHRRNEIISDIYYQITGGIKGEHKI